MTSGLANKKRDQKLNLLAELIEISKVLAFCSKKSLWKNQSSISESFGRLQTQGSVYAHCEGFLFTVPPPSSGSYNNAIL